MTPPEFTISHSAMELGPFAYICSMTIQCPKCNCPAEISTNQNGKLAVSCDRCKTFHQTKYTASELRAKVLSKVT